jgi:hypothetical protein
MVSPSDRLELDYTMTADVFKALADIRFRLLALVPSVAGLGVALLGDGRPTTQLGAGLLGLVATTGVLVYELRNSQLYNWSVHRARYLERRLGLPASALGVTQGGVFGERPPATYRLAAVLRVKHDHGLGLVYGAALGGWVWLTVRAALALLTALPARTDYWIALAAAAGAAGLAAAAIRRHDVRQPKPTAIDDPVAVREAIQAACTALDRAARRPEEASAQLLRSATLLHEVSGLSIEHTDVLAPAVAALRGALERIVAPR